MVHIIKEVSRLFVGVLFIFSGIIKVNDPVGTSIKLKEYFEVFAADFASFFHVFVPMSLPLAVFICVLEVLLGFALLLNYRMRITAWVLLLLIVFFTFLTFYSAYFNKVTDCGCFGDAIKLTPWQSFYKDIILLIFIAVIFIYRKSFASIFDRRLSDITVSALTVVFTFLSIYAIQHLPYIDFRSYKAGNNISKLMQPSGELAYEYIMEKDGKEYRMTEYPTDKSYKFKEMVILNPEVQPKITDYNLWNDEGDYTEDSFEGNKLYVIVHNANTADHSSFEDINELIKNLAENVFVAAITASDYQSMENLRNDVQLAVPYYYADATVLKTIVRSNPGIWLMQDGVVKGKWHYNDVPDAREVENLLN